MVYQSTVRLLAAKRVPLIRFRKGGLPSVTSASSASAGSHGPSGQTASSSSAASARPTIESWELPPRYQRKPMDDEEIAYINRGGPE